MPRKAKEIVENEKNIEIEKKAKKAKTVAKKASSKKTAEPEKKVAKKTTSITKKVTKPADSKKISTQTASSAKKSKKSSASAKSKSSKKTTSKTKTSAKGKATKKVISRKVKVASVPIEYYDLPYHYDQTVVKVLAQTPKSLFVYWDISNSDRQSLLDHFGENFFNDTIPFLRVINENSNYSFDVDIDDFANGWYISVPDAKATYKVLLYRKQRPFRNKIIDGEIYLTTSNNMEAPNDHILFEKSSPTIIYKNVKNGRITKKIIPFNIYRKSQNAIYGLYEYYKEIYQNEDLEEVFNLNNPSSSNPTSTFK